MRPAPDEIEVAVFGPGYGECIVVHIGKGRWLVVDSCIDPATKEPQALAYLRQIGVDPSTDVIKIIASHWHDDHTRGLGATYEACTKADLVVSVALNREHFLKLVECSKRTMIATSGLDEFGSVLAELERRRKSSGGGNIQATFAIADRSIFTDGDCRIHALSPSDTAVLMSKHDFAELLPRQPHEPKRRILPFAQNRASIVIHISACGHSVLLGGDLEEAGLNGWSSIIASSNRPQEKASLFKVPHHGSKSSHHPDIWRSLLVDSPIAVLSPFVKAKIVVPSSSEISTLCFYTNSVYSSASPRMGGSKKRSKAVERTIKENFVYLRKTFTARGYVRLRAKLGTSWQVKLFDDAMKLCA